MASIFTKSDNVTSLPSRNTFPMSYANNLSLKAGQIVPCYLQDVMPGDSIKIDTRFGFQFMPMIYPVQTDMQCNVHFFYVRNRALWKGWENFITKTENLDGDSVPPYIQLNEENRKMFETGDIGDYVGVPTVYYSSDIISVTGTLTSACVNPRYSKYFTDGSTAGPMMDNYIWKGNITTVESAIGSVFQGLGSSQSCVLENTSHNYRQFPFMEIDLPVGISSVGFGTKNLLNLFRAANYSGSVVPPSDYTTTADSFICVALIQDNVPLSVGFGSRVSHLLVARYQGTEVLNTYFDGNQDVVNGVRYFRLDDGINKESTYAPHYRLVVFSSYYLPSGNQHSAFVAPYDLIYTIDARFGIPNSVRRLKDLPFSMVGAGDNAYRIRVSAMPFRAVEACYNAFYRDDRNNPLMIDGKPYYNVWVQNRNGGADTTRYTLYNKNWEQDVFTTAVQSPQQGIMPLVGVTASGNMTFSDEDGNTYYLQAEFGDDGKTITGISSYSSDMPVGTLRAMVDTISTGISINDFRNVNALQRWLETNMRKGLRYKDQIEAHFGTSPTYSELQMPEFIGGLSRSVHMSAVEQTVDTVGQIDGSPLGTLAGRASAVGEDGKPITHYCDEHGWIIGFVSITPRPVYSQTLNKMLTRTELLDYYFPEFGHIGFQPILNKELAPLQCTIGQTSTGNGLDDVFGYQRAWYEYLERYDEVHGDFRTTLRDFLIQRVFDGVPKLGKEFLLVGDKEVNEVFAVQDDSDKIFGQMVFDVVMKRPIPKFGVPKLEVG